MPSNNYHDGMTAPQLSVRSRRARDLAHELSRREGRPIHAIVEEALTDYASRHPRESAANFLKRMRAASPADDAAIAEMESAIAEHKRPHEGIEL
jgi:hypothetical protein